MHSKMKRFSLYGFLGAVLFMIGDCLIYIYPGRNPELDIDPVFAQMPLWRFQASAVLGWFGMIGLFFGFLAFYAMTKELCKKWIQRLVFLAGAGVLGTALAHFNLGSLQPYIYKAVLESGGTSSLAQSAALQAGQWNSILDALIILLFYLQLPVFIYIIASKKSGLSRWFLLLSPFGAILMGLIWKCILTNYTIAGAWGSCESLGEGFMYLSTFFYWKKYKKAIEIT